MRKLWIPLALAAVILVVGAFLAVRSLPTRNGEKGGAEVSRAGDTSPTDPDLLAAGTSPAAQAEVAGRVGDEPGAETILPGEPVLHGKVTDEEGRPIEGAFIHLQTGGAAMFRGGRGGMNLNFIRERLLGKIEPRHPLARGLPHRDRRLLRDPYREHSQWLVRGPRHPLGARSD